MDMNGLQFVGDWSAGLGIATAVLLAAGVWWLYRADVKNRKPWLRWTLPSLRALAVFLLVLMFTGPVFHSRKVIGQLARLFVFVDTSESMGVTDASMETGRKLLLMQELGWIPDKTATSRTNDPTITSAIKRLDALPRLQRIKTVLFGGEKSGLLKKWAATNRVEFFTLRERGARKVWESASDRGTVGLPDIQSIKADGDSTDLSDGISANIGELGSGEQGGVILFSDGRHNDGGSPLELARLFRERHLPIFTVGVGSQLPAKDLAVRSVDAPLSVFHEDHLSGRITLNDEMPAGKPFVIRIENGSHVLWEESLMTEGKGTRVIPFDFAVKDEVKALLNVKSGQAQPGSVPLAMRVSVTHLDEDQQPGNDVAPLRVRALTQRNKVLLLDGRPRWEWRYLHNLLERDRQWEVNALVAGADEAQWVRGDKAGSFPMNRETLLSYDLIIFGDVPKSLLKPEELGWIKDFVGIRGGGLVFIDGQQGALTGYAGTPLETLLPVLWKGPGLDSIEKLSLTSRGENEAPLALDNDRTKNSALWKGLRAPHWIASTIALPGTETLVEGLSGERKVPAVVSRRFGSGKVLYFASDESWRWRYEVADRYQARIWSQIFSAMTELPFAVRDAHVALDTNQLQYKPGDSAIIRTRLRDNAGHYLTKGEVQGTLVRDGEVKSALKLTADENGSGVFRGATGPLTPGHYELGVSAEGFPESDTRARVEFDVEKPDTGELTVWNLDESLMRHMAEESGGHYLREEQAEQLGHLIEPLSQGKIIEREIVLSRSYWWFLPIVLLFTTEWVIRKRTGML